MSRTVWDIVTPFKVQTYHRLVRRAHEFGDRGLFVVRDSEPMGLLEEVLDAFSPHVTCSYRADKWPGTELLGGQEACIYEFNLNQASAALICSLTRNVFDWLHPNLPEDLCLLHSTHQAWFICIAHERDAYFELTHEQYGRFGTLFPEIALVPAQRTDSRQ